MIAIVCPECEAAVTHQDGHGLWICLECCQQFDNDGQRMPQGPSAERMEASDRD